MFSLFFQLKMWIAFLIPKIEDGNNFGVSIQEETLEEIRSVESEASLFYEQMSRYYVNRAKLISKASLLYFNIYYFVLYKTIRLVICFFFFF